jgi:hypothetical protein
MSGTTAYHNSQPVRGLQFFGGIFFDVFWCFFPFRNAGRGKAVRERRAGARRGGRIDAPA